ncbi:MAG: acyl-CoA dehydrogenase, partial [Deltaproteobacteria bacterium]|nr:acyl-CoA dehydrogenase [Deltaproteobacteria bacterium]
MANTNFFKADLRELEFALFEHFRLAELFGSPPFDHMSEEDARMILKEAHGFASEVIGPTLQEADREGCRLENGKVVVPESIKKIYKQYFENGWNTLAMSVEREGQGAPHLLDIAVWEMMTGANPAFSLYPGLTNAAAEVISSFGSDEQKKLYLKKLQSGEWAGTMLLTEPNAGSDVGLSSAKAVPKPDGSFSITGNKLFISGGDQNITPNIIHLALARVEGAPRGTKGLSLFIIPKFRVQPDGSLGESNDVTTTNIEHKLGIHASSTAALALGENGRCTGWLVGGPREGEPLGEGMKKMFLMMNNARIGVGTQALAVASTAYLNALDYARKRLQGGHLRTGRPPEGAVPIINHPDVRRMLMEMKCQVEGCRALMYFAQRLMDQATVEAVSDKPKAQTTMDYFALFIPLVKAHLSDVAVQVTSTAMQVYGGAGYTNDYPAEQYLRDARIFPIYEGTNGIQAMDLVGRKLAHNGGAEVARFSKEVAGFATQLKTVGGYDAEAALLEKSLAGFNQAMGEFMNFLTADKMELIPLSGTRFLEVMSRVTIAWLLLQGAL